MWCAIGLLRLIIFLPWNWQMSIGSGLGKLMYQVLKKRRHVANVNLKLAFPEKSAQEREELCKEHFISLGQGLMDLALSWWGSDETLQSLSHIEGKEHLFDALDTGGVILLSMHFTSLEVGGPIVSSMTEGGLHVVYKAHKHPLLEHIVAKIRARRYGKAIPKTKIRGMISSLKRGHTVWFAPDQSFQHKNSLQIPFFGIDVPTNPNTSRLSSLTNAQVVPFITVRLHDDKGRPTGYLLRFFPALSGFPSDDVEHDTLRINQLFEEKIREFPAQYLWTHKRFKNSAESGIDYYARSEAE